MKVGFTHYGVPADVSGVTTWLARFIRRLALERPEPGVATSLHVLSLGREDWPTCSIARELAGSGVELSGGNMLQLGYAADAVRDTLAFLDRARPDVFIPQCLPAFHHAAKWAGERGIPWVFTMHADDPVYWALAEQCGPDATCGAWVVVSDYLADRVRGRFPKARVETIPCGVDVPAATAAFRDEPFLVVYSGRLVETQKRASLVAATLIEACRRMERIEAVVLGDGPARASMEEAVAAAGLTSRIRFAGRVPPEQMVDQLADAQAILMMSDFEGMPVALMEAMAVGVVPVARSIPSGIPELVKDGVTGCLVDDSPHAAAEALALLASSPETWRARSAAARSLIRERYAADACFDRWRQLVGALSRAPATRYPLRVPRAIALPPVHPALRHLDIRRPSLWRRMAGRAARAARASGRQMARVFSPAPSTP